MSLTRVLLVNLLSTFELAFDDNFHTRPTSYENDTFYIYIGLGAYDSAKWLEGRHLIDEPEPTQLMNWSTGTIIVQMLIVLAQLYLAFFFFFFMKKHGKTY